MLVAPVIRVTRNGMALYGPGEALLKWGRSGSTRKGSESPILRDAALIRSVTRSLPRDGETGFVTAGVVAQATDHCYGQHWIFVDRNSFEYLLSFTYNA